MIRIRVKEVQEHLDELLESRLTIHITSDDDPNEVLAVMVPIEDYNEMQEDIARLEGLMK